MRALATLTILCLAACSHAQEPQQPGKAAGEDTAVPSDFVRFVTVGDGGHLDTAITTYRNQDGVEVTLLGAVHIADPSHYRALQQRFESFDALLYELVGPSDQRPKPGDRHGTGSPISLLQTLMKKALELQFQLDAIDYTPANFVHADMTGPEFERKMQERGESLLSMMWQSMASNMQKLREQADSGEPAKAATDFDLVKAFRSGEGRHTMRLAFAQQLEDLESLAFGGEDGSTLLEGRNEKCLEVLQQQIQAGVKKLGIYYGAAHLPHMEKRLCDDLGFHKVKQEWLLAWDCSKRPDPKFDREQWQRRQKAGSELEALAAAARKWRLAHERLPQLADLLQPGADGEPAYGGSAKDPWGNEYVVQKRSATRVEVVSAGADGKLGTDDDLVEQEPRRDGGGGLLELLGRELGGVSGARQVAEVMKAKADLRQLHDAITMYMMVNATRKVPTFENLLELDRNGQAWLHGDQKDPWGNVYLIRADGEAGRFKVLSCGPDGKPDTDDDVRHQ